MQKFDVAVIGAGAAGLMCAAVAGQRGLRVVLIDHQEIPAEKIRISGGGRCNFTNRDVGPANFLSSNPRFCRSALAGYGPADFIALVRSHGIAFHEKHRGQLFCDRSSDDIITMLQVECDRGHVARRLGCKVLRVGHPADQFLLECDAGEISAAKLVVATGGLSIPKIGASDFGYRIARQFGLRIIEPRAGLVPLTFESGTWKDFADLSGIAVEVEIACRGPYGRAAFREDMLFTHRGLSGPAVLQISSHWLKGAAIEINLAPSIDVAQWVATKGGRRGHVAGLLGECLPKRLAETWAARNLAKADLVRPVADLPDRSLRQLGESVAGWRITPDGSEGFRKAEVTIGGVDTRDLASKTMQANHCPGLHFIGEVVDVTGWLGGYNFQWAWASAVACARAL